MTAETICKRFGSMESIRESNWESHWDQIAEVIAPRFSDMTGDMTEGDKKMQRVYDSTGIHANGLLAAGLHGIATNPATRWFGLRLVDDDLMEDDENREFLSDTEGKMYRDMQSPASSISTHLHEVYLDAGAFGWGVMFIGDDNGRPRFQARHLREMYLSRGADGDVDTVFRCFKMTARQLKQMAERVDGPQWAMPEEASDALKADKPEDQVDVIHAVYPRDDLDSKKRTADNMPYASIYVTREKKETLYEGGFEEFPYAIFEWSHVPGETYARGPGMEALPDVKMLQEMMKVHIRAGQKLVDPPLLADDDAVLGPLRLMPGGINYRRPGADISPLVTNARLDLSFEMMQDVRNRISLIFHSDIVRPFTERTNETATEVMQRVQQQMRLLGPVLGRLERFLGQIITRVYGIMSRAGRLDPVPEALKEQSVTVEFVSPIATAQRASEVEAVAQWLAMNAQALQIDPSIADQIAWEKLPEWTADRMRIDPELVRDKKGAAEAAQQRQAMQAMAAAQPVAAAAKDGAQAVATLRGAA